MEEFMGTIKMFSGDFAPQYWMFCHGQTLPINSYQALFSILGTTYGGDGHTHFKLPDLRSRIAIGQGRDAIGTTNLGEQGGSETTTAQPVAAVPDANGVQAGLGAVDNRQPFLGIHFIICVVGLYPSRW
jgi:microcystin-dependent protein